jgi:hypothetical protein
METHEESLESDTSRPPWPGWLKCLGWGVLIVAIVTVAGLAWNRGNKASKLQATLAELDRTDPGWRLEDIEAAREPIPEGENSARVVVAVARLLPKDWPPQDFDLRFLHLAPEEQLAAKDFAQLNREMFRIRPAVDQAIKLTDMPRGRHDLHYARNPIDTLLPDQSKCRDIVALLCYESVRQNQKGDSKRALAACQAALNAARSLGDEPIFISQLIRNAGVLLACRGIERALAQGEPPSEDMAALQKLLENEDAFHDLLVAMRGERASLHQVFELVERGELSVDVLFQARSSWLQNRLESLWHMDAREDNVLFLSLMTRRIEEVKSPLHEQVGLDKRFEQDFRTTPKSAVITRLLLPTLTKLSEASRRKHAYLRCTIAALAVERYRQEKTAWPGTLAQLCPTYLAAVPLDPFDGKPLRYRRLDDGVVIYSVGSDGVDNDGTLDRDAPTRTGADIGFRLWDVAKRRQPPKAKAPEAKKPQ